MKQHVTIPVAVKLGPFFSSLPNIATRLDAAGANALVLFNRFYQPDLDIEALEVCPHLVLSTSDEMRLPLRWIAILYGQRQGVTGPDHRHPHRRKMCSRRSWPAPTWPTSAPCCCRKGVDKIGDLLRGMTTWMEEHEYESVAADERQHEPAARSQSRRPLSAPTT